MTVVKAYPKNLQTGALGKPRILAKFHYENDANQYAAMVTNNWGKLNVFTVTKERGQDELG